VKKEKDLKQRLVQHLSWKRHLGIIMASVGVFERRHLKQKIEIGNRTMQQWKN
jgi:hypothetical protein